MQEPIASTCVEIGTDDTGRRMNTIMCSDTRKKADFTRSAPPSFASLERKYLFARTLAICIIVRPIHEPKEMPEPQKGKV